MQVERYHLSIYPFQKRLAEHRGYDSAVEIKILLIPGDESHRTEVLRRIPANGGICGKHLFTAI